MPCEHGKRKYRCRECKGVGICYHDRRRYRCRFCRGASICDHNKERARCRECNPGGHLHSVVSSRVYSALKNNKELSSLEYLCCSIDEFKAHIQQQFLEGMSWENYGEWHIDHKKPIRYKERGELPDICEVKKRLHYTNTQPLWALDNMSKGCRFVHL